MIKRSFYRGLLLAFSSIVMFCISSTWASEGETISPSYLDLVEEVQIELKEFDKNISKDRLVYNLTEGQVETYRSQLDALAIVYMNLESVEEEKRELSLFYGDYTDQERASRKRDSLIEELGKPPFPVDSYLKFLDEKNNVLDFLEYAKKDRSLIKEKGEPYRDLLKDIDNKIAVLRDGDQVTSSLELKWKIKELTLRKRYIEAVLLLNDKTISNLDYAISSANMKVEVDGFIVGYIRDRLVFKDFELLFHINRVKKRIAEANQEILSATREKKRINKKLEKLEKSLLSETDPEKLQALKMEKRVLLFVRESYSSLKYVNLDLIEAYALFKKALKHWKDILSEDSLSVQELIDLRESVEKDLNRLEIWKTTLKEKHSRLLLNQKEFESFFTLEANVELEDNFEEEEEIFQSSVRNIAKVDMELDEIWDIFNYLIEDIDRLYDRGSYMEKLRSIWENDVVAMLNWQIWSVDENPITIIKLLKAITILFLGIFLSRYLSSFFKEKISKHMHLKSYGMVFIETGIFSIGLFFTFMTVLWVLHIPLTAFAFLGGAFALAFGLGAQKIFSDLFSGVMLMAQRKIRNGDIVIIDGQWAEVTGVNSQNTQIKTYKGHDIIYPNTKLLESQIVNVTLSDSYVRSDIKLGVGYDSDMKRVMDIVYGIVSKKTEVLHEPKPEVFFTDFGESSLDLVLSYYVNVRITAMRRLASRIRLEILDAFRQEGIEIPYPKRDLYIKEQS